MQTVKNGECQIAIIISANAEWESVIKHFGNPTVQASPFGAFFQTSLAGKDAVLFHGGWGKISAAASAQYVIDRWKPELIINAGTCGGLAGKAEVGEIILADSTLVYDIYERMGDPRAAISQYATHLDLSFLREPYPQQVRKCLLVSADQDIDPRQIEMLISEYAASAADWESGAIAWVARQNNIHCLILRGVSDLVNPAGGEIYESGEFHDRAEMVMIPLLKALPNWIRCATWKTEF